MADVTLGPVDRVLIRNLLIASREAGNPNPVLPADIDIDGDGVVDGFALDENDQVIVVRSALGDTLYEATGEDE